MLPFLPVLAGLLATAVPSQAQQGPTQVKADVKMPEMTMQNTPLYTASNVAAKKDSRTREWLEVEVEFETRSDSKAGLIPEVMVTYYIAVKGLTAQILTDSFTYTNVIDKESNHVVVYVSPPALTRINGEPGKFRINDVAAVGVEVLFNGRVVGASSSTGSEWWTSAPQPRVSGLISAKENTPFSFLWIDRHLELKR
jgi:hypothetical protein